MATHNYTWGEDGRVIEATCVNADGSIPAFDSGTFQIEVFRKNQPTSLILDAAATSPSAGKLRYTFTNADRSTIPNLDEQYSLIWWWSRGGILTAYPEGGYDALVVTADPVGTPADVTTVVYASKAYVDGAFVPISGAATIIGWKTFQPTGPHTGIKIDSTVNSAVPFVLYRNAPPSTGDGWEVGMGIKASGAYFTNAWMVISGANQTVADSEGYKWPTRASGDPAILDSGNPSMLSIRSDLDAAAVEIRALGSSSARILDALDDSGLYRFIIEKDGSLSWGNGVWATTDVHLTRTGAAAMHLDAALAVDGRIDAIGNISANHLLDGNLSSRVRWPDVGPNPGPSIYESWQPAGAASIAHIADTSENFAGPTSKLWEWRNQTVPKNSIDKDGKLLTIALQAPPTVTGSRGTGAALVDLLSKLAGDGVIVDGTVA